MSFMGCLIFGPLFYENAPCVAPTQGNLAWEDIQTAINREEKERIERLTSTHWVVIDKAIEVSFPGFSEILKVWDRLQKDLTYAFWGSLGIALSTFAFSVWHPAFYRSPLVLKVMRSTTIVMGLLAVLVRYRSCQVQKRIKTTTSEIEDGISQVATFRKTLIQKGVQHFQEALEKVSGGFKDLSREFLTPYEKSQLFIKYVEQSMQWIEENRSIFEQNPFSKFINVAADLIYLEGMPYFENIQNLQCFINAQKNRTFSQKEIEKINKPIFDILERIEKVIPKLTQKEGVVAKENTFARLFYERWTELQITAETLKREYHPLAVAWTIECFLEDIASHSTTNLEESHARRLISCIVQARFEKVFDLKGDDGEAYVNWVKTRFQQMPESELKQSLLKQIQEAAPNKKDLK